MADFSSRYDKGELSEADEDFYLELRQEAEADEELCRQEWDADGYERRIVALTGVAGRVTA